MIKIKNFSNVIFIIVGSILISHHFNSISIGSAVGLIALALTNNY
jgi:hypothetical protein